MRPFARRLINILDSKPPRGARGQSLAELALTAPILFLMVIGIAEIGFLANNYMLALDAIREGGRYAVLQTPLNWHTSYTVANGDQETRNQQRTDCETTKSYAGGARYHVNRRDRDLARVPVADPDGHPTGLGYFSGNETDTFGFYDGVMCQVVAALDPLYFNYRFDDVAVSVIAYANRCATWNNGAGAGSCYRDPANLREPQGTRRLTITGRFPLANRKCVGTSAYLDTRDPFQVNGQISAVVPPLPGAGNNDVRGFIVMGNMKPPGVNNCIGSWFYLDESKTNYATPEPYNLDYLLNDLDRAHASDDAPSGAMVLVELYWNHAQLFNFPPFNLLNDNSPGGSGGVRMHLWQVFPMTAAEPTPTNPTPNQP
jgi:hypothetical protein